MTRRDELNNYKSFLFQIFLPLKEISLEIFQKKILKRKFCNCSQTPERMIFGIFYNFGITFLAYFSCCLLL